MEQIENGWFREKNDLWPGQCFSLQVKKILHHEKSQYQDILVIETTNHGRTLILDGIIQCTEHDEFSYQEMISFLPLCAHKNPKKVLIVGGGDGGVARDVSKHPLVEQVFQVEIDERVIEVSKKYLPFMAEGFRSPKLTLKICDGFEFMRQHKSEFDVIITDSSDPVGPAVNLFTATYFELLKHALKPGGIICSQGGTVWSQLEHVRSTISNCKKHFPVVDYAIDSVPTYPTGLMGYVIASLDESANLRKPKIEISDEEAKKFRLRYYNSEVHTAAFAMPNFVKSVLKR